MIGAISSISSPQIAETTVKSTANSSPGAFHDALSSAIQSVENSSQQSSQSVEQFLNGEGGELHTAVLATQKAELEFELFMQVRNKIVGAYQEIMRMQL
jgi:flagellar hook-basal body complex protein FliE